MTETRVELGDLLATRAQLMATLHSNLSENHKSFLISFKEKHSDWPLLSCNGVDQLPAVKWKLINLEKMNRTSHEAAVQKLKDTIELI